MQYKTQNPFKILAGKIKTEIYILGFSLLILMFAPIQAWDHINNIQGGTIQISNDGGIVAFISERDDGGDKVLIEDKNGNRYWDYYTGDDLNDIAMTPDAKYMAVVGNGVHMLSLSDKKILWSWTKDGRSAVSISNDGKWIAAGGYGADVYIFEKNSSTPKKTFNLGAKEDYPRAVAITNNGKYVAVAGNLAVYLLDVNTGNIKWQTTTEQRLDKLQFSYYGEYLLGKAANSVYFWKTGSSKPIWQNKYAGSLIGAAMTENGDKIVVSHKKGISVYSEKGKELKKFENSFGNSDAYISLNGRYIYVNSGSRRLYVFDDSYSNSELRPFRIIKDLNAGGQGRFMELSGFANKLAYPIKDSITFQEQKPGILAVTNGVPILLKDQQYDLGVFVTNPGNIKENMKFKVTLSLPASFQFWNNLTSDLTDKDPVNSRSKLVNYALDSLPGQKVIHTETISLTPGNSKERHFTETVPDLADGNALEEILMGGMGSMSPLSYVNKILGKFKGPLAKLIGENNANYAIAATTRAATSPTQPVIPVLGLGTVALYDSNGNFYDQDNFYFMYMK